MNISARMVVVPTAVKILFLATVAADLSIVRSRAAVRALLIALVIVSESRLSHNSLKGFFPTHSLSL